MPGSRAPSCSSIERASTAKRSTPLANTAGSMRDDELSRHRGRAFGIEIARRLGGEIRAGHARPRSAPPSARAPCPWRRQAAPSCRRAPRSHPSSACHRHRAPSPRGSARPSSPPPSRCRARPSTATDRPRSARDPAAGQANAIGLVPNTARLAAPRRHRGGSVGEEQRRPVPRPPDAPRDDRPRRNDASVRCRPPRCPFAAVICGRQRQREIDRGIGEAVVRIDHENARPRLLRRPASRSRRPFPPSPARHRTRVRNSPCVLMPSASASTSALATTRALSLRCAAALERARDQRFRVGE